LAILVRKLCVEFPFSALTLLVERQEGYPGGKNLGVGLFVVTSGYTSPVITTTSVILCSSKIQNGDIRVPANPSPPGKWPIKRRVRENAYGKKILIAECTSSATYLFVHGR